MERAFSNRTEAGRSLAEKLEKYANRNYVVVLGLPRGGVPVAFEVALALDAPLDVIIVRKLGVPVQPELGMGALGEDGVRVLNAEIIDLVFADAVLGKLNLRKVPFNVRVPRVITAMGVAAWVGQGLSKPVGKAAFDLVTIPFTKVAIITLLTEELAVIDNLSGRAYLIVYADATHPE